ncbi:DUF4231 domain-containing protein [Chitinophaga sp. S165]|uniref:DUF4231 domain-containing protein n=1 Tax=Chitinophaga sp. S165 TaxID=2135462 RepID=UPI001304EBC4|nr:DUF4231 domain-containing protein [Chitinophaga sp. S165]
MSDQMSLKELHQQRMRQYIELINQLPIDAAKKKQLNVDFINYIFVLHNLARKHMWLNDVTNVMVIILSAVVPIMINVGVDSDDDQVVDTGFIRVATILSVILAVVNAFRQAYKYRDRWQSHLETAEQLILEGQSYFSLSGTYSVFATHELAFKKFIETVNLLRSKQISKYINQILSVNDKEIVESINTEIATRTTAINTAKDKVELRKLINDEVNAYAKSHLEISYFEIEHDRMLITLFTNTADFVPPEKFVFKHKRLSGIVYRIEMSVAEAEIQSDMMVSSGVKNKDMPNRGFGNAGCILKRADDTQVFVTCYHVVKHNDQDWDLFVPGAHDEVIDTDGNVIGKIIDAEKSAELDTALVELDPDVSFDDLLPNQVTVKEPIFIDEENLDEFRDVFILSRVRNFRRIQGRLAQVNRNVTLNYGTKLNPDRKNLDNVMIVHFVSTEPFSLVGDSGSLVFAEDGIAIGLLVGGDKKRASFVIPFTTINDHYNLKFE